VIIVAAELSARSIGIVAVMTLGFVLQCAGRTRLRRGHRSVHQVMGGDGIMVD
jgi:hypothetical protein